MRNRCYDRIMIGPAELWVLAVSARNIISISHCSSTYSAYIGFNENSFHTFTLSVIRLFLPLSVIISVCLLAHRSAPSPLADLEIKAPTRSEIRAISIRWKNWKPWEPELFDGFGVDPAEPPTMADFLFLSKAWESSSF